MLRWFMKFKIGDLVRVKESTHDEKIPPSRSGLIVADVGSAAAVNRGVSSYTTIWQVLMTNGITLRFHEMFLEKVGEEEDEKKS